MRALEKVGLKFSDIIPLYLTPAEALPAFERGDIDAWLIWDPYTAEAERKLRTRLLADNSTVFGDKAPLESPSFYYAAPDFVRDHSDIVKIILQELEKAGTWSRQNYKDSAQLLSKVYKTDVKTMEIVENRGGNLQEGRRQRAEGRRDQLEGDCDPSQLEAPKSKIWEGLHTLTPFSRGQRTGDIPSASCLLPSAFPGQVLPVTDDILSGLQRMADTFYELKIIPKKIDVKDKNYNWFPDQKW